MHNGVIAYIVGSPFTEFSSEMRAEPVDPMANTRVADVDAALTKLSERRPTLASRPVCFKNPA